MKKKFADEWVRALRSREYKQGKGWLYDKDKDAYCCLGVLCVLAGMKTRELAGSFVPEVVMRKTGLRFGDGHYKGESLTFDNDYRKKSFFQIATIIEKNWRKL
jgi:hypothetical protein